MYSSERTLYFVDKNKNFDLTVKENPIATPFNNTRTLKFKAQPTNAFFATVNQVFGDSSQLPTTIKSLSTVQKTKQCSAVIGSWEESPNI